MGDISSPIPLSGVAVASDINDNLYSTQTESLRVINGYLDSDNKASDWTVGSDQIRNQSTCSGSMIGLTGNLDYVGIIFPSENTDSGAYTAVPGCCIEFHLPFDPSLVVMTWMVQGCNNQHMDTITNVCELKMYLDDSFLANQFRVLPPARESGTVSEARRLFRDRIWSGHSIKTDMTKGFHRLELKVFNSSQTTRLRIRNIKIVYFR